MLRAAAMSLCEISCPHWPGWRIEARSADFTASPPAGTLTPGSASERDKTVTADKPYGHGYEKFQPNQGLPDRDGRARHILTNNCEGFNMETFPEKLRFVSIPTHDVARRDVRRTHVAVLTASKKSCPWANRSIEGEHR
jgi:hypothetical protein